VRRLLALLLFPSLALAGEIARENLEKHVRTLASPEFEGRRGPGARKAEAYVEAAFRAAGLETSIQEGRGFGGLTCRNVVGVLRGGKTPAKEHMILSAHYDHLGMPGGVVHPGAADNAAGVAALLEIARLLKPIPDRDVLFLGFDLEEVGLWGSREYCRAPLRPLEECVAFVTVDILGRDLADVTQGILFCVGLERSEGILPLFQALEKPEGLRLAYVGADVAGDRSDFAPFRDKRVPFAFFTASEYADYHRPSDTPDRLDFEKLVKETELVLRATRALAAAPRPKFSDETICRVEEAESLEFVVGQMLDKSEKLGLTPTELGLGRYFQNFLKSVVKSGQLQPAQRQQIVGSCQMLMGMLEAKR